MSPVIRLIQTPLYIRTYVHRICNYVYMYVFYSMYIYMCFVIVCVHAPRVFLNFRRRHSAGSSLSRYARLLGSERSGTMGYCTQTLRGIRPG